MKIVNQTIGRAIRHQNDWAKIYLIDERFTKNIGKLSKWLRNRCNVVTDESIF
jgi:Rad3-related DNA helicase